MSRRAFIQQNGATCRNWAWSWSFVNNANRFVIFGAWDSATKGDRAMILSQDWEMSKRRRRNPGYVQAREHIRLIEDEGYALKTFPLIWDEDRADDEPSRIKGFTPKLTARRLVRDGNAWYAVPL